MPGHANARGRILLVEDDDDIREIVGEVLVSRGYRVIQARTGLEALRALQKEGGADLILLDMMMPDMDGREFLKRREGDPLIARIPVVVVTAAGRRVQRPPDGECAAWLSKPVDLDILLATVAKFCKPGGITPTSTPLLRPEQVSQFLARRRGEIPTLREAIAVGDYRTIQTIGHNLRGSGASFGFESMSALGERLEEAAATSDAGTTGLIIEELAQSLAEAQPE
jgi:CheY-like chemotaxis protein